MSRGIAASVVVDPVTLEIISNALVAASREMGTVLQRASYSTIIREARDFSCAIFDAEGRLASQAAYIPLHLGSMGMALAAIRDRFSDVRPDEAYLLNDPYSGAQHTPDIQLFSPVFHEGTHVAWVGTVAHHLDVGGRVPGSVAGDNTEIYHDGLRIPPCRAYVGGELDPLLSSLLAANVRQPDATLGDLRAQHAANMLGVARVQEVARRYTWQTVHTAIDQSIASAGAILRSRIQVLPESPLRGEDWIDDDGVGNGPFRIAVSIQRDRDHLIVDFTGSSPEVAGPINSVTSATRAAVMYVVRAVFAPELPANHGGEDVVTVVAPPRSIVNPEPPAACGGRTVTCHRIVDAMLAALSEVVPSRITSGSNGNMILSLGGVREESRFIFVEVMPGGMGARSGIDGVSGTDSHLSNCMNPPIEALELEHPVMFDQFEFRPDSGGAGKSQGGLGLIRQFRLLEGSATLMLRGDQAIRGAIGLREGESGLPCRFILNPGTPDEVHLPTKVTTTITKGDVVRRETGGGGGFGPARERPIELINRDIAAEKVTRDWACQHYVVVERTQEGSEH